jgi:predicted O-methyltransferase YrrM
MKSILIPERKARSFLYLLSLLNDIATAKSRSVQVSSAENHQFAMIAADTQADMAFLERGLRRLDEAGEIASDDVLTVAVAERV